MGDPIKPNKSSIFCFLKFGTEIVCFWGLSGSLPPIRNTLPRGRLSPNAALVTALADATDTAPEQAAYRTQSCLWAPIEPNRGPYGARYGAPVEPHGGPYRTQ